MAEPVFISVREIVGGPLCIATEDGDRVRERIAPPLREGHRIVLSFAGVAMIIPAFLSSAIGQLYGEFPATTVDTLVHVEGLALDYQLLVEIARQRAKDYFRDPERYKQAVEEVLENGE